jgi:hypothetical protein
MFLFLNIDIRQNLYIDIYVFIFFFFLILLTDLGLFSPDFKFLISSQQITTVDAIIKRNVIEVHD